MMPPLRPLRVVGLWLLFTLTIDPNLSAAEVAIISLVDISGTMKEEQRLETAKAELEKIVLQLPPSKSTRWAAIEFNDQATSGVYHDAAALRQHFASLTADGRTSIAEGLKRTCRGLKWAATVQHVILVVYSDGDDNIPARVMPAYEQVSKLIQERKARGFGTTVIARRWKGANDPLIDRIQQDHDQGILVLIDAGSATFELQAIELEGTLSSARWSPRGDLLLAEVELKAKSEGASKLPVRVRCVSESVSKAKDLELVAGQKQTQLIQIPRDQLRLGQRSTVLAFEAVPPSVEHTPNGLVIASLLNQQFSVDVPFEPYLRRLAMKLAVRRRGEPTWIDPVARTARVPVRLAVGSSLDVQSDTPIGLSIVPVEAGWSFLEPAELTIVAGQRKAYDLEIQTTIPKASTGTPLSLPLEFQLANLPDRVVCSEDRFAAQLELSQPPPVPTGMTTGMVRIRSVSWRDPLLSEAEVSAEFELTIDGPLPGEVPLTLRSTDELLVTRVEPGSLQRGSQQIAVTFLKKMIPDEQAAIALQLGGAVPDSIELVGDRQLELSLQAPPALRLIPAAGNRQGPIQLFATDEPTKFIARVRPVLFDERRRQEVDVSCPVTAQVDGALQLESPAELILGRTADLILRADESLTRAGLRDRAIQATLTLIPKQPSSAIANASRGLVTLIESPLRWVMIVLSSSLLMVFGIALVVVLFKTV